MSSHYSSTRSSMAAKLGISSNTAKNLAISNGQPKSWFEISSHVSRDEKYTSGADPFDIGALIYKLQMHQLEVEEDELRATLENKIILEKSDLSTDISILESLSPVKLGHEQVDSPALPIDNFRFSFSPSPPNGKSSMSAHSSINALPEVQGFDWAFAGTSNQTEAVDQKRLSTEYVFKDVLDYDSTTGTQVDSTPSGIHRTGKPSPLKLVDTFVPPQEVQSASLPPRSSSRAAMHDYASQQASVKKHHRRMTISGARNPWSNPILTQSPGDFAAFDIPPVPDLTLAFSATASPPSRSPATPTEDQIRRELEANVIEEGVNGLVHKRTSEEPIKRRGVFIPSPDDVLPDNTSNNVYTTTEVRKSHTASHRPVPESPPKPALTRKKSIFARFERKNEVDQLLDLYLNNYESQPEPEVKQKRSRSRKHSIFRQRRPTDNISDPIPIVG